MSEALRAIWEAAGYPWSVRLKALLPLWLPWARRRLALTRAVERQLFAISPRQMDRWLAPYKRRLKRRRYGRTRQPLEAPHPAQDRSLGRHRPGFTEIDLVGHSGDSAEGEFVHSLNPDRHPYDRLP